MSAEVEDNEDDDAETEEEAKSASVQALEATVASQQAQIDHMYQFAAQATGQHVGQGHFNQAHQYNQNRQVHFAPLPDAQRGLPHGYSHDVHEQQRRHYQETSARARAQRESQLQWNMQQQQRRPARRAASVATTDLR